MVLAETATVGGLGEALIALVSLTALEIVLGIDNVVFIAILSGKLPEEKQAKARTFGLLLAMVMRLVLLALAWLVIRLETGLFALPFFTEEVMLESGEMARQAIEISSKDLLLLGGGLFLIAKAVWEIHETIEGELEERGPRKGATMTSVLMQVLLLDLVFSLDSVITAVGMTDIYWVMATAVVISIGVMLLFAGPISAFVKRHPTMKTLALAFLVLIGVLLVADGLHQHLNRGYVYFAMGFALAVELVNLKAGARRRARAKREAPAPVDGGEPGDSGRA